MSFRTLHKQDEHTWEWEIYHTPGDDDVQLCLMGLMPWDVTDDRGDCNPVEVNIPLSVLERIVKEAKNAQAE